MKTKTFTWERNPLISTLWYSIKRRCNNPKCSEYPLYGGRGIKMCKTWQNNRNAFCRWCEDNGWKKGLQIDRINNNGNYTPSNCRFVSSKVNCRNKSDNKYITIDGQTKTLKEWCEIYNANYLMVQCRLGRYGWTDPILALTLPKMKSRITNKLKNELLCKKQTNTPKQ